jgi:hypothetical protein
MSSRPLSIGIAAAAALLLAACGEERVASYRVPKEKDPELPMAAADSGAQAAPGAGPSMADTSVPTAGGDSLAWQAPAGWAPKAASAMRKGSYSVPGGGGESDLSITAFPGDVGGELANVNRWRGQVGLTPLGQDGLDAAVTRFSANGLSFTLVDLSGQGDPGAKAILGAIVPFGGSTWFFKLTGTGAVVGSSKAEFIDFLHTVKAP